MKREKKRSGSPIKWTAEDRARHRAIREKFQAERPTLEQLVESGEYGEPILLGAYWELGKLMESLRQERERQGLSLGEAAKRSGIDKAALSRLEGGQQVNPTWNTLTRYAAALGKEIALDLRDIAKTGALLDRDAGNMVADANPRPMKQSERRRKKKSRH